MDAVVGQLSIHNDLQLRSLRPELGDVAEYGNSGRLGGEVLQVDVRRKLHEVYMNRLGGGIIRVVDTDILLD